VNSRFSFNAGVRLDHYSTFGTTANPRMAAIFRAGEHTKIRYTYGRAFRAPNSYELYYSDQVSLEPNPNLQPETIESHNIAVEGNISPQLHVSAEAFLNDIDGLIDTQVDPSSGLLQHVNAQSCRSKGLEFSVETRRNSWRAELSYTLQKTEDALTHARLANNPLHLAKLKVQGPLHHLLLAAFEMRYVNPQYTYLGDRIPDHLETYVTFSTRKPLLGFDLSASCYNLFNRHNYDPVAAYLRERRILQNGREFRIKITRSLTRD
jgi:iron complex outermembrane receptor protein